MYEQLIKYLKQKQYKKAEAYLKEDLEKELS